jgi:ribosomal protein S14
MPEKTLRQVCECRNCGNEAEMEITCSLEDHQVEVAKVVPRAQGKTKGHAVCSHCGGEADIWLDM